MTAALHSAIAMDLSRPHRHAFERVGFVFGKLCESAGHESIVYLYRYMPVIDQHYMLSDKVGALIDSRAILGAMQEVRNHRGTHEGVFHVHMHQHRGQPSFGSVDQKSLPCLIPGFQRMDPTGAHGLLLLSADHGIAWTWLPGIERICQARRVAVVGAPTRVFSNGGSK